MRPVIWMVLSNSRCVSGLGVGALSAIVPLYIGEAAPKKLRGTLLVLYQVQIITGLFLAYIVNLGTHHMVTSSASWRVPIGLQLAWGIFLAVGALALPESPRLLLGKGKDKQAVIAIARLNDCRPEDTLTIETMRELGEAIREENEGGKAGWLECFGWQNNSKWTPVPIVAYWASPYCGVDGSVEAHDERNDGAVLAAGKRVKGFVVGGHVLIIPQLNGQNFYYYVRCPWTSGRLRADMQYGPVFFEAAGTSLSSYGAYQPTLSVPIVSPGSFLVCWPETTPCCFALIAPSPDETRSHSSTVN